jgi:hypothetical protein
LEKPVFSSACEKHQLLLSPDRINEQPPPVARQRLPQQRRRRESGVSSNTVNASRSAHNGDPATRIQSSLGVNLGGWKAHINTNH